MRFVNDVYMLTPQLYVVCSVGTLLFTAIGISALLIGLHGALRVPDDLFLDSEVSPTTESPHASQPHPRPVTLAVACHQGALHKLIPSHIEL